MISFLEIKKRTYTFINQFYIYIAIFLVIIMVVAGYFFFFKQEYGKIREVGIVDLQGKQNELEAKRSRLSEIEKAHESFKKISGEEIKKIATILPKGKDTPSLLIEMEALAKENGLILSGIDIAETGAISVPVQAQEGAASLNIKKININFKIQGINSYDKFKTFLSSIEKDIRLLDLNSLTYSPAADSYSISLVTYYQE